MRVSLNRRIDRIRDFLLVPGSLVWRLERLSDAERVAYAVWAARCDRVNLAVKNRGGNLYGEILADPHMATPMPRALERALFPYMTKVRAEPDARLAWNLMLEENL